MNKHMRDCLKHYTSLRNPGYAILVTGEWGIGKSFQVKNILGEENYYNVSLFGIRSIEEIYALVYSKMFPYKDKARGFINGAKDTKFTIAGAVSISAGSFISNLSDVFLRSKVSNEKIIVFDDLERCSVNIVDTLGAINSYVEHHGCRVIVIAHDEKLVESFASSKEKIFGRTLRVMPEFESAFRNFSNSYSENSEKKFLENYKDCICGVFHASGCKSLRIMKQSIDDLMRIYKILEQRHLSNKEAISELVQLFFALSVEVKSSFLREEDLIQRYQKKLSYLMNIRNKSSNDIIESPPIVNCSKKYSSIDLTSTLLSDESIISMLFKGSYDSNHLHQCLDNSIYFMEEKTHPHWMIVGKLYSLPDTMVEPAISQMIEAFKNRQSTVSGEVIHIFSLMFMLSSRGLIDSDYGQIETQCMEYVNDLLKSEKIESNKGNGMASYRFLDSYEGIGFWIEDDYKPHMTRIIQHLENSSWIAYENSFKKEYKNILKLVKEDGKAFFENICSTHSGKNDYATIPIMASIPPNEFVDSWLESPPSNWYWIASALRERYKAVAYQERFRAEQPWINMVVNLLNEKYISSKGLTKVRLKRLLDDSELSLIIIDYMFPAKKEM